MRGLSRCGCFARMVCWLTVVRAFSAPFAKYLEYCRSLRFDDKPDYAYLRRLFRDLFYKEGLSPDFVYDWTIKNEVSA